MINNINLYAPINELGYGVFSRGLIKGLIENGLVDFHLCPIGKAEVDDRQEHAHLSRLTNNLWTRSAPSVAVWHEFELNKFGGNKMIAYPGFETTRFNGHALNYLQQMDAIFVLSTWAKSIVEDNIGDSVPVHVVPSACNQYMDAAVLTTEKNSAFTFLSVGKLEIRKSQIELFQAYIKAFADCKEDTRLLCHCFSPFDQNFAQTIATIFSKLGMKVVNSTSNPSITAVKGNAIIEIPMGRLSMQQIFQLYKYAHIGVFPAKGEGWNLPLMEAIQSGLPCIATNYSGHTEYLKTEYNYNQDLLLNNFKLVTANDGVFFKGDRGEWASINIDELADKMMFSFKNYSTIIETFDNAKLKETFNWKNTGVSFLKALETVV